MLALGLAIGMVVGAVGAFAFIRPQMLWLRSELTTAQDRLYAAWQEKAVIPPREAVQPPEPPDDTPLPQWATTAILDFSSPAGRQQAEAFIRQGIAAGKSQATIMGGLAQ